MSRDADDDAILAAAGEAARDAVADSTQRLIIAFRRFCVEEFGRAPTEDDFRQMLAAAALTSSTTGARSGSTTSQEGPRLPEPQARALGLRDVAPASRKPPEPYAWCESCGYAHPIDDHDCIDARLQADPEPIANETESGYARRRELVAEARLLDARRSEIATELLDAVEALLTGEPKSYWLRGPVVARLRSAYNAIVIAARLESK